MPPARQKKSWSWWTARASTGKSYWWKKAAWKKALCRFLAASYRVKKGGFPMTQHEITKAAPLLDASGNLTEPGWARSLLPVYCRSQIRAPKTRIKEWDYYCITDGHIGLALTIADNGYMGLRLYFVSRTSTSAARSRKAPCGCFRGGKTRTSRELPARRERDRRVRLRFGLLPRGRRAAAVLSHGQLPRQGRDRGHSSP